MQPQLWMWKRFIISLLVVNRYSLSWGATGKAGSGKRDGNGNGNGSGSGTGAIPNN